ncbi:hypothetical protein INR49_021987 [Caranx melampygus]|nr:hypothetical protein INR49_021987 [Caranx melampygus]
MAAIHVTRPSPPGSRCSPAAIAAALRSPPPSAQTLRITAIINLWLCDVRPAAVLQLSSRVQTRQSLLSSMFTLNPPIAQEDSYLLGGGAPGASAHQTTDPQSEHQEDMTPAIVTEVVGHPGVDAVVALAGAALPPADDAQQEGGLLVLRHQGPAAVALT